MQIEISTGYASAWVDAVLSGPITLYDLSGTISGYLFSVTRSKEPAGYLTVAAIAIPNPVLEFATDGPSPLSSDLASAQELTQVQGYELLSQQPLYLGLLGYAYELTSVPGTRRIIFVVTGEIVEVDPSQVRTPLISLATPSAKDAADITALLAYKLISGVPDWNQFWGSYGCLSGCSPTAATNAIGYWDGHGYGNLIYGGDWQGAVNEMRTYMGTWCTPDGYGATYRHMISPGIIEYTQAHGYYFESRYWCDGCSIQPTYANYRSEMDANNPMVVCVSDHWKYGGHCMTGVGYDTNGNYMIVHDNWGSTGENVYVQYGSGYSDIGMISASPDNTPPTKASNVRPEGWTGPYTNDNTPRFRWNGATDVSGIQGYYVAVDDWTPEGSYGNDWWAGNVTAFTVPQAQPDGQHIFAVTSVDNAGNVNPPNTNQQGDAPYYTFYVDTTAPTNPTTANSGCSAQNGVWQNTCDDPNFTWSGATDATSGVAGYQVYWGSDPNGTATSWTTSPSHNPPAVGTGTYYLRTRTKDQMGNWSNWKTLYTFRYDDLAPSGSFSFSGGELSYTINTLLNLNGTDIGSGVSKVRLSNNGTDWTEKEYAQQVHWTIPATDGQWYTVYLRFVDAAGNFSPVYQQQVCLDLTPPMPSSASYRLWPAGQIAGGGYTSAGYRLHHTEGQPFAHNPQISSHYRLHSGFQATWPSSPGAKLFTADGCAAPPDGGMKVYLPIITKNQ
jgi:hypothetical protein